MKFRTYYYHGKVVGEVSTKPSMVDSHNYVSLERMLHNHSMGIPITGRNPIYSDDPLCILDDPDVDQFDVMNETQRVSESILSKKESYVQGTEGNERSESTGETSASDSTSENKEQAS